MDKAERKVPFKGPSIKRVNFWDVSQDTIIMK
jgi:hypothetical protein